jgi:hypothetical protein
MLWRTFRNNCGRLYRWNQTEFWQPTLTAQDPAIPNLPLETPVSGTTYFQSVAGSLSFTGGMTKKTLHIFSATPLPFTGVVTKKTGKPLAASLTFAGSIAKKTARTLDATLLFAGNLFLRILRSLAAGLTFSGQLVTNFIPAPVGLLKRIRKRISLIQLPEEVSQWLM